MPLDRMVLPSQGTKVAFWKITESTAELLQMYNPEEDVKVFIESLPEQRQQHFLASRLLVKSFYPDNMIAKDSMGKPFLKDSSTHFSWSHSGQFAAAIFCENNSTGIDIEKNQPRIVRIEDKFCNHADKQCIVKSKHAESLLIIWAAKESMYKWYGLKEVDFRKHMTVQAFDMADEGRFTATFHKPDLNAEFLMQYSMFDGHIAVWIVKEIKEESPEEDTILKPDFVQS